MSVDEILNFEAGEGARQFVTFLLAEDAYGVDINRVVEIIGCQKFTPVPGQPSFMPGILNLRGEVAPVIDLRLRFGLPPKEYDRSTVVVIVSLEKRSVGFVVDSVSDVVTLSKEDLQPAPQFSRKIKTSFIEAIGSRDGSFLVVLDVNRILQDKDLPPIP